jgi:hypothetical protein
MASVSPRATLAASHLEGAARALESARMSSTVFVPVTEALLATVLG